MVLQKFIEIIAILQRDYYKDNMDIIENCERRSFIHLFTFMLIGCGSLAMSYYGAFSSYYRSQDFIPGLNVTVQKAIKPYNSYSFTKSILIDGGFQCYSIVYMTLCFVSK